MEGLGYDATMWISRLLTCVSLLAVGGSLIAALVAAGRAKKDGAKTTGLWILAGALGVSALNGLCFFTVDIVELDADVYSVVGVIGMLIELGITVMLAVGLLLLRPPATAEEAP